MTREHAGLRILLAEDDENDAALIEQALRTATAVAATARVDTAEAFDAAVRAGTWDVVISDHAMPCFSAHEALAILKATGRDVPFIIVSGTMKLDAAVEAMRAGARDYLLKSDLPRLAFAVEREVREARFRAELAAMQQEKRAASDLQALLLENLYDAVIGLDPAGIVTAWNAAAQRQFGWPAAEAIGRPLEQLVATEFPDGASMAEVRTRVARDGVVRTEARRRGRDGHWIDVELTSVAVRSVDGSPLGYVAVNRDVTVRKRAELALRASQERLRRILETCNEGICIMDVEGRIEFANARVAEQLGVSEGDLVGQRFADVVPESIRADAERGLEEVRRGEGTRREIEVQRPDGTLVFLAHSRTPLRADDGSVAGAVAVLMDLTAARRAHEQLVQAQKLEAVGRLASGIAHDFNNLLVVVLSNSDALLESLAESDERRTDVEVIRQAGERAARLVRQLLTFARRNPHRPVSVDVNGVVQGLEKLLRRTIGEDVEVKVSLEPQPWPVLIDPGELEQVLMNLAVNARDAMPQGGRLTIETGAVTVGEPAPECEGLAPGRYSVVTVADTGCGMSPETLSRIFEPFFTTKPPGQGTGLGLSTALGIVERANGRILVRSRADHGTMFSVYLPESAGTADRAAEPERPLGSVDGRNRTALVAEDDDHVREIVRRILAKQGFQVLLARTGAEAVRAIEAHPEISMVLSDQVMPEGSGRAVAAAIARWRPGIAFVLMTGYAHLDDLPDERTAMLAKPFTDAELIDAVRDAMGRARVTGSPE